MGATNSSALLQIQGLNKSYSNGERKLKVLAELDLYCQRGEFIAIAGPSGSGKTTLLNCIGCIDDFDSGSLKIAEREISDMKEHELTAFRRETLGFIFQSYNLLPVLKAWENVAMPLQLLGYSRKDQRQLSCQILQDVGLGGMEESLPSRLSGGQQQRVAIARSLVKKPAIVLADEPTANLDSYSAEAILQLMHELNQKLDTTFIFSTHDQLVMKLAKRLVQLRDGKIQSDVQQTGLDA